MAGEAQAPPQEAAEDEAIPTIGERQDSYFPAWLRLAAKFGKGSGNHRAVRLAKLGVSGAGTSGPITPIPPIRDPDVTVNSLDPIKDPYSFIRISYQNVRNEFLYEVTEPPMGPLERQIFEKARVALIDRFKPLPEFDTATKKLELRRMV